MYYIKSHVIIREQSILLNGQVIHKGILDDFTAFSKAAYKALGITHPKFFKMDPLSKLAFLSAECILGNAETSLENDPNIALVFANRASSLDTDRKHQEAIEDQANYFPSPAVFVYTLPNICLGEISIKHKLHTENSFFIFDSFQPKNFMVYAKGLMHSEKADEVLCGWVEFDGKTYESFLYLVSKGGNLEHTEENLQNLYNACNGRIETRTEGQNH